MCVELHVMKNPGVEQLRIDSDDWDGGNGHVWNQVKVKGTASREADEMSHEAVLSSLRGEVMGWTSFGENTGEARVGGLYAGLY